MPARRARAADVVASGASQAVVGFAGTEAIFALTYAHKKVDIIPDFLHDLGRADDSSIVRAVLIQNEKALAKYASAQGLDWARITSNP